MITPSLLRPLRGLDGVFTLFHELGYPIVAPIQIDPEEWRRAGIALNWNGTSTLHLAARTRRFDLFVLQSDAGEESIASLCRREGIAESLYYNWSKEFLEAGKKRLAGDTARAATSDDVKQLRRETRDLKEVVAEQALELRLLKKSMIADGGGDE